MSEIQPIVIGEGTYGCVHRPSLKCKKSPQISYKNKTSKIIIKSEAKNELKEYAKVKKADPKNDFYLGVPEKCTPDKKLPSNHLALCDCNGFNSGLITFENSDLLIMEDGGENIYQYVNKMKKMTANDVSTRECELFLLESLRMFRGVLEIGKHGLVHHDLKPQNVVYNKEKNRLNIIDFGLMQHKKEILDKASKTNYNLGTQIWFNFPWEIEILSQNHFLGVHQYGLSKHFNWFLKSVEKKDSHEQQHVTEFIRVIVGNTHSTTVMRKQKTIEMLTKMLEDYKQFYIEDLADPEYTYNIFAHKCVDTIDSFGLGYTLMYWLANTGKFLDNELQHELFVCFSYMITPRQTIRYTIEQSIVRFEEILERSGLLEKYKKKIVGHVLLDKDAPVSQKDEPIVIHLPKSIKIDPTLAELDPPECIEGKEKNPKTNRCVKKCKNGYVRNDAFRCIKIKKTAGLPHEQQSNKSRRSRTPNGTKKNQN